MLRSFTRRSLKQETFTMNRSSRIQPVWLLTGMAALFLVGCQQPIAAPGSVSGRAQGAPLYTPAAAAGVNLPPDAQTKLPTVQQLAQNRSWSSRGNPFGWLASEAAFDRDQLSERLVSEGGFMTVFEQPDEQPESERITVEPQPLWRLSGVVVGPDAILALLDVGPGEDFPVRPGQSIPGTEWVCVSIDTERAIFRRDGNVLPREVIVPLTGPLMVPGGGGGGGAPAGGGSAPAGRGGPGGGGPGTAAPGMPEDGK